VHPSRRIVFSEAQAVGRQFIRVKDARALRGTLAKRGKPTDRVRPDRHERRNAGDLLRLAGGIDEDAIVGQQARAAR